MRNAGLTLVAIALASCGRLDFDDLRDGGSRIDAPIAMLDSGTTDGTTDGSVMLSDAATAQPPAAISAALPAPTRSARARQPPAA